MGGGNPLPYLTLHRLRRRQKALCAFFSRLNFSAYRQTNFLATTLLWRYSTLSNYHSICTKFQFPFCCLLLPSLCHDVSLKQMEKRLSIQHRSFQNSQPNILAKRKVPLATTASNYGGDSQVLGGQQERENLICYCLLLMWSHLNSPKPDNFPGLSFVF